MNKNTISWTHYIYATITASVLAYVTVMDTSKESDDSATNMLPNIDNSSNNNVDDEEEEEEAEEEEYEEPSTPEEEAEPSTPEEESTTQEPSIPIAEPVESEQKPLFGSSRRKLKKNNTKTSKKNSKNTKTHRRH